ncbi:MAG: Card1-like endonuclease domain-containing protein [Halothiobacillaceae bacterium]
MQENAPSAGESPASAGSTGLPTTHLALVSHHPMPTLGPLLDPGLGCQKAILVAGREREQHAWHQAAVLERHGLAVQVETVRSAYDLTKLRQDLALLLPAEEEAAINVTGGSKLMSIAAHMAAEELGHAAYYIHLHEDSVLWLNRDWPAHAIADRVGLVDYLRAIGLEAARQPTTPFSGDAHALALEIASNAALFEQLQAFTGIIQTGKSQKRAPHKFNRKERRKYNRLEVELRAAGIGRWESPDKPLSAFVFTHPQGLGFINGVWLEYLAEAVVRRLAEKTSLIHDVERGLLVRVPGEDATSTLVNELDVMFLFDNALFMIECKTGKNQNQKITEDLHRLETLRDQLGGIRGKALLLSLKQPGANMMRRASTMGIGVCAGFEELSRLEAVIVDWLEGDPQTASMS